MHICASVFSPPFFLIDKPLPKKKSRNGQHLDEIPSAPSFSPIGTPIRGVEECENV